MPRKEASARNNCDVVIVGGGPTGLVFANLLDRRGLRFAIVDPNRIVCTHPCASHIDDECMRLIQTLGYPELEKDYLVHTGIEVFSQEGECLINWDVVTVCRTAVASHPSQRSAPGDLASRPRSLASKSDWKNW